MLGRRSTLCILSRPEMAQKGRMPAFRLSSSCVFSDSLQGAQNKKRRRQAREACDKRKKRRKGGRKGAERREHLLRCCQTLEHALKDVSKSKWPQPSEPQFDKAEPSAGASAGNTRCNVLYTALYTVHHCTLQNHLGRSPPNVGAQASEAAF